MRKDVQELANSTTIIEFDRSLPDPITAEDIKKNPGLRPVAIAGANAHAIKLYHIVAQMREVKQTQMQEKDREELLSGLKKRFDEAKAVAHYLFPDSAMFQEPGNSKPTPY
jgi:hypothetical protein